MHIISRALLYVALVGLPVCWADQIVMKDGDRVTGSIVKKDGDTVTIDSKNFGMVTLKWADIATVTTDQAINVELPDDRTVKGKIQTRDGKLELSTAGAKQIATPNEIVALRNEKEQAAHERLLNPGPFDLWVITGSLNIAGTKGNAATSTLTTPFNFVRASKTSRTTAYFNSIRAKATLDGQSELTAKAVRGGWGFSRNVTKKLYLSTFNDYEYDQFQSLDLRVVLGGGVGYDLWKGERGRFALVGGLAWNHEKFGPADAPAFTRNSAEAYWGDDFNYKLNARTSLTHGFRMFNNLSNGGEYRLNFDVGAATQLTKWLNWNVSVSDRYLSNPAAGRKNNDLLYSTGLGFTFAR
ncbi:MAG: DUF481 domain-containing protein [Acidobacteriota bacterium]